MWELSSKRTHSEPGMPRWTVPAIAGVASSKRPEVTSVGAAISPRRSTISHVSRVPTTWNSLGPFIVWQTSGAASSKANERSTSAGFGTTRQTWRS